METHPFSSAAGTHPPPTPANHEECERPCNMGYIAQTLFEYHDEHFIPRSHLGGLFTGRFAVGPSSRTVKSPMCLNCAQQGCLRRKSMKRHCSTKWHRHCWH
eukprot:3784513-Amphidinium_carterae.1